MTADPKPAPKWLRVLRASWAALLILALAFSILMAAWGDLRESLMLRTLDTRLAKSFLLQFPEGARVWIGDEPLEVSRKHPLAQGEPDDSEEAVEGMRVVLPRVYLREEQLLDNCAAWVDNDTPETVIGRLAPGWEVLHVERDAGGELPSPRFIPVVLGKDGRIDYAILGSATFPVHDGDPPLLAFLLRVGFEDARVFSLRREEIWSDQLWAPEGEFWSRRDQYDGFPPILSGQTRIVWRWYFAIEPNEPAWRTSVLPKQWADAPWADLPAMD